LLDEPREGRALARREKILGRTSVTGQVVKHRQRDIVRALSRCEHSDAAGHGIVQWIALQLSPGNLECDQTRRLISVGDPRQQQQDEDARVSTTFHGVTVLVRAAKEATTFASLTISFEQRA
jgi:hypothetical protein